MREGKEKSGRETNRLKSGLYRIVGFFSDLKKREETGKAATQQLESLSSYIAKDQQEIRKLAESKELTLKEAEKQFEEIKQKTRESVGKIDKQILARLTSPIQYNEPQFNIVNMRNNEYGK